MSLIPFIYVACSESSQDAYACKEVSGEAMPLFPIPPPADRISNYDDIIKKSLISLNSEQSRNNAISGPRREHQYILQLDTIADDSLVQDYRKIYAFASGETKFHNTQKLTKRIGTSLQSFKMEKPRRQLNYVHLHIIGTIIIQDIYHETSPYFF